MQLLIHSLCLTLQLLLCCPISVPPAQPALNIRLKTNGLVTVEAADCDQNHEQQKAKPWALSCSPQVLQASWTEPESHWNELSLQEVRSCRRNWFCQHFGMDKSAAAAQHHLQGVLLHQYLLEFNAFALQWAWALYYRQNLTHCLIRQPKKWNPDLCEFGQAKLPQLLIQPLF